MYEISELKNGLKVATCRAAEAKSVALGVWIGVGGRYEAKSSSGISHFIEHMVFKGTKKRTYRQIKESIEGLGGLLNGFTSEEVTCFMAKVLDKHSQSTLDVLLDIITNPLLKKSDITKERLVIFEEIKMYFDLPNHLAYDRLLELLWPNHALGRNLAGDFDSLKAIDKDFMLRFMKKYYDLSNVLVTACGNISHSQILNYLNKILKNKNNDLNKRQELSYAPVVIDQKKPNYVFLKKDTQQTHLCLGFHALRRRDPLRHAMTLLHVILGANMSSRLFNEVREKNGYAYEIATATKRFSDTGAFIVHAGVVNKNTENALNLILEQLKKISQVNVKKSELSRAKIYCRGQLLMGLEDTLEHMSWFGESIMTDGKPQYVEKVIQGIEKVTAEEVKFLAKKIFTKNKLNLSVVGPVDDQKRKKLINILRRF
ncbi:MAG: insulinase family protein [Candidatus Omnitrophica bacterium]|nr:insulinase family protein [Candidatus Omnitrophota bacterium]